MLILFNNTTKTQNNQLLSRGRTDVAIKSQKCWQNIVFSIYCCHNRISQFFNF